MTQLDAASYTRVTIASPPFANGVVSTGATPTGIAATTDGRLVLVASQDGNVTVHDGPTGAVLSRFVMRGSPFRVIVSRSGARAYALSSPATCSSSTSRPAPRC